jgi:response regulator RpfG family c-di-GMP phosphodiesterase
VRYLGPSLEEARMKKIYIVDDDRNIVESVSIVLKSKGYEIQAQYDEENLLKNVEKYRPDLVILDVMFPEDEGAGFEMARTLKRNDSTKSIPILMLSAVNVRGKYPGKFSNKDRDDSYFPVEEFADKPINPKDLLAKVEAMLKA